MANGSPAMRGSHDPVSRQARRLLRSRRTASLSRYAGLPTHAVAFGGQYGCFVATARVRSHLAWQAVAWRENYAC